ncbi:TIGR04086 family membrane protein [Paenibacillus sp. JX-17]|uniref:TIGR04086 family membrane protein n=1 Tax=Paenibacillus lacisoli TaxID=3064525 RepID=A0ABT9CKD7_9BACL|nr:TIGR04086 family membrane protein [Paenibacillus sp. JX-17]MDO7908083.1 TIGR04086 family membrane protein [Paenibacillus sp. JX-17]
MEMIRRLSSFRIANPMLSGMMYAFLWMMLGAFVLSLLLWTSGMSEKDLNSYTNLVHGIALAAGGFTAGKRSGSKGWYYGGLTGVLYGLAVILIGFLALDSAVGLTDAVHLLASFVIAAIGGMVGVQIRK